MIDFGEGFSLFFVVKLADGFGGISECWIINVDDDLGNDSGDFAVLAFFGKSIVNSLGEPVTDLALAHSNCSFKWHGRSFVGSGGLFVD